MYTKYAKLKNGVFEFREWILKRLSVNPIGSLCRTGLIIVLQRFRANCKSTAICFDISILRFMCSLFRCPWLFAKYWSGTQCSNPAYETVVSSAVDNRYSAWTWSFTSIPSSCVLFDVIGLLKVYTGRNLIVQQKFWKNVVYTTIPGAYTLRFAKKKTRNVMGNRNVMTPSNILSRWEICIVFYCKIKLCTV